MKDKFLISFIIMLLLDFLANVPQVSAELTKGEQQQAETFAAEVARDKKLIPYPEFQDYANKKIYDLMVEGKKYWDAGDSETARNRFEAALALSPHNERIIRVIDILRKSELDQKGRRLNIETHLVDIERLQDIERAYLTREPKRIKTSKERPAISPKSELHKKALGLINNVDFRDAEIKDVLEYLSKKTDINIVIDETVVGGVGRVTVHLRNVTLIDTLEIVLRTKGLSYRLEDNLIWISSQGNMERETLVTKIYNLSRGLASFTTFSTFDTVTIDNIRADNERVIKQADEKGKGEKTKTDTDTRSAAQGGVKTFEGIKIGGSGGVAGTVTMTIKDVLLQNVSWPEGSSVFLDQRTSKLIVRNTPTNILLIDQIIEELDINPPQIMIEARFVEVRADDLKKLGVDWNTKITATGAGVNTTFPFKRGSESKYQPTIPSDLPDFGFGYGLLDFTEFQAVLSAIEENTKSNLLSAPKVTTISGQEAIIKVVKEYRYPTRYSIQTYKTGSGDSSITYYVSVPADFKTRDIGIILKVTPNVGADGKTINLTLVPEVSEFDIENDMYNYGTIEHPYLQPFFTVQNCTASIVVEENQTVVMGGLMKEDITHTVKKVPLLGDIPMLGKLFRHESDDKEKKNLLIFVTAHLISPASEKIQAVDNL
ncbi:MAG: secretin and TonB N-terminal domain-containing protein [Candidatus Omnitrophota bacterium]